MDPILLDLKIKMSVNHSTERDIVEHNSEHLDLPDFLDSDSSDHSADDQPLDLILPNFIDPELSGSSFSSNTISIVLPNFGDDVLPSPIPSPNSISLHLPQFQLHIPSVRQIDLPKEALELPAFEEPVRPLPSSPSEEIPLFLSHLSPPIPLAREFNSTQQSIELPVFNEPSRPSAASSLSETDSLAMPYLKPNGPQKREYIPTESSLTLPTLEITERPQPLPIQISSDILPELDLLPINVDHPLNRETSLKPSNLNIAFDEVIYHPIVKRLNELLKTKSYAQIIEEAKISGSTGDVCLLLRSRLIKERYSKQLMDRLCKESPSLLPQSTTFHALLKNDQEQIDRLAQVCQDLIRVNEWKKVQPIFKQNLMLTHLIEQCQRLSQFEISEQQGLLQLKREVYCFLVDILRQEEEALKQYEAERKNLTPLKEGLTLLASHIESSSDALKMGFIRDVTVLDFSPWEDHKPLKHSVVRPEQDDIPGGPDLNECLQAIRSGQPRRYHLQNFTFYVLQMREGNERERSQKVQYLLDLSNAYFKLGTPAALKQAICWIELAITILEDHVEDNHPLLLNCYESRGAVRLKMAGKVEAITVYDNTVPRKHMDASYRDFHHSLPLAKSSEVNYVRRAHNVRDCIELDYAQTELSQACCVDENYAEARYLKFLKEFEKLKLNTTKTLHPQCDFLSQASPKQILEVFKTLLIELTSDLEGSQFKITSAGKVIYIQFRSEGIAFNQPGTEALESILTHGVQNVRIVNPKTKIYFAMPISVHQFHKLVSSHADNQKRLHEVEQAIQQFDDFELSAFYKTSILDSSEQIKMSSIQRNLDKKLPIHVIQLNIQAMNHHIINGRKGSLLPFRSSKKTANRKKLFSQPKRGTVIVQQRPRYQFSGSLEGENINFNKIAIAGDGNCGFTALGVTRKQMRDVLFGCSDNEQIRQRLKLEVLESFITGWLTPTRGFTRIYQTWMNQTTDLDSLYRTIRDTIPTLPHFVEQSIPRSIEWLNENNHLLEGQQLQEAQQRERQNYQALLEYCANRKAYVRYCENYLRDQWLGYESAVVYAEQQQLELCIWEKIPELDQLNIKTRTTSQQTQNQSARHLLFSMGNHFDRLLPVSSPSVADNAIETQLEIPEFVVPLPSPTNEPIPLSLDKDGNNPTRDVQGESYASALLYACRAISSCDRLLSVANNPEIEKKRFNLLIKRAFIYKKLNLIHCHVRDLEEVLAIARKGSIHYLNPSIHYALYQAYIQLNRVEEAKEQHHTIHAIRGSHKGKKILRNIELKKGGNFLSPQEESDPLTFIRDFFEREELKGILSSLPGIKVDWGAPLHEIEGSFEKKSSSNKLEKEKTSTRSEEDAEILAEFQDKNITEECLQILRSNQRANSLLHPHRKVPVWETFAYQLGRTTTIKDFCEVLLSSILIKGNVEQASLLRIAKLSNLQLKDPSFLDELKSYMQDAIEAYREEERRAEDKIIEQLEQSKLNTKRETEFLEYKKVLKRTIKDGEFLRPGSNKRQQISTLSVQLEMGAEGLDVHDSLIRIFGVDKVSQRLEFGCIDEKIRIEMYKELSEILENALDLEVRPPKIENHVLHIQGTNLFLSQIIDTIRNACAKDKSIRDVHILGVNVYLDKSIKLNGINLAVGGEYLQFIKEAGTNKLSFDLSGEDGANGKPRSRTKAPDATTHGHDGSPGERGNDGKGGKPGGDFCLKAKDPIIFTSDIIEEINLNGGKGGRGSDGQAGGNGADGVQGEDARKKVRGGDLANNIWHGYIDHRHGGKAIPAGAGGRGGDGGIGGKGGESGRFLAEGVDHASVTIKTEKGADGEHGNFGAGGKSGEAKRDGLSYAHVKGGFFSKRQTIKGIDLFIKHGNKDREQDGWGSRFTVEESIRNNQRQSKGRGKSAEEQTDKKRDAEDKNDLKRDVFNANHAVHLHTQSAEQKVNAFDEVTNRLSQAQETEEIVREQLAAKQHKLEYIDTLIQTTAAILHEAQTEQTVTTQHSRIATLESGKKKADAKEEVADILNNRVKDKQSLLPISEYSPVLREPGQQTIRSIDIAIHHVNVTRGQNTRAIADLVARIGELPKRKYQKDPVKLTLLVDKLSALIRQLPLHLAMEGWSQMKTAARHLRSATALIQAIKEKDVEVSAFREIVQIEEQSLNDMYKKESQQLIIEKGMLRLLQRNMLLYLYLTKKSLTQEERRKRKSWFQGQLYQKVYNYLHFINKDSTGRDKYKPTQDEVNWCLNFANAHVKKLKEQIGNKQDFKKILLAARKKRNGQLKHLHTYYHWISERLPDLVMHQVPPSTMCKNGRFENLYIECTNAWSNLSSLKIGGDAATSSSSEIIPTEDDQPPTHYDNWINMIQKEGWDNAKAIQLETHVKQLIELQPIVIDVTRYLQLLEKIYAEEQLEGLPEVLIELIRSSEEGETSDQIYRRCCDIIQDINTTSPEKIHDLRQYLIKILAAPGAHLQNLSSAVERYLQIRHLLMTKKECLNRLNESRPHLLEDQEVIYMLSELLLKANDLFKYRDFLPSIDFLRIASDVFYEYAMNTVPEESDPTSSSSSSNQSIPSCKEDLFQKVLKLVLFTLSSSGDSNRTLSIDFNNIRGMIDQFHDALGNNDAKQVNRSLFVLLNLPLSYAQLSRMSRLLENKKYEHLPNVKAALLDCAQKMITEKVKFDQKWQAILERARLQDHLRRQLDESDCLSIERSLLQIAQEANLLTSEETAEILEEMADVMSRYGCFMIPSELKKIQHRLISKMGCFPESEILGERLRIYNSNLKAALKPRDHENETTPPNSATSAARSNEVSTTSSSSNASSSSSSSIHPFELLATSFMKIIEDFAMQSNFLQPCLVAIHHLPLKPNQRITLFCAIESLSDLILDEQSRKLKKHCLNEIRESLIGILQIDFAERLENRKNIVAEVEKKQQQVVTQIGDILNQSNVLYAERYLAKLDLWFKLINRHYEFTSTTADPTGDRRKSLCQTTLDKFKEKIERSKDTEAALAAFNVWLRDEFTRQSGTQPSVHLLEELVNRMQQGDEGQRHEAKRQFDGIFWCDLLSYYSEDENQDTVLKRMEGRQIDVEVAKQLKLKFDEQLLRDESYQIRKQLEEERENSSKQLVAWIASLKKRLSSDALSGEALARLFPNGRLLHQIVFGSSPIPHIEEASGLNVQEIVENIGGESDAFQRISLLRNALPQVQGYLRDLDKRLTPGDVTDRDIKLLNILKKLFKDIPFEGLPEANTIINAIDVLELNLIDFNDYKNKFKKEAVADFIEMLNQVNNTDVSSSSSSNSTFTVQYKKNLARLEESLAACCTLMGEDLFMSILDRMTVTIQSHGEAIDLKMLAHLFWVLPRLRQPSILFNLIENRLPNKWALTLLENHCLEEFSEPLSQIMETFTPVEMNEMTQKQKDEFVEDLIKKKKKECEAYAKTFTKSLAQLLSTTELTLRQKEDFLQFLAVRLSFLNHCQHGFTLTHFIDLVDKYLTDTFTLRKLSEEFYKTWSLNRELLLQPSFQSFKYGLTLTWIQGTLEHHLEQLNEQEQNKLFDALFQIETAKKEETMRAVVESLNGSFLSPAVVECVVNFAQGTWLLDSTTLKLLGERTPTNGWYSEIEQHTKTIRSQKRDLKTLVKIMADEGQGINRSINHLLISEGGNPSQLERDITDIQALIVKTKEEFDEGLPPSANEEAIKGHRAKAVKRWARAFKGERCLDTPENLKKAIAVVSIANEIAQKYLLRDTQLIALWLTLMPGEGRDRGRIGQVFTGEGKSFIFAGLSVLRALTGSYVDVITTSYVLATKDSGDEKRPFFDLFDLTISNNCDREAEADEGARRKRYYDEKGPVNIVYGEVGSFERDILLTEFHDKKIIHEDRLKGNRTVLVDEVDGLFLDSAGMVLYLSHNVDGLKFLRRIFVQIFTLVNQPSLAQARPWDDRVVESISSMIKQKLASGEITLPQYAVPRAAYMQMQEIIDRKLSTWIRSALHSKVLNVNNQYIITDLVTGNKKKKSITVMDKGTGVEQYSLKWSDGLYIFLQLKHGLELSDDSLKAVFLSNFHFFKRYGQHIYGLSGTLGSNTEQKYLEDLYNVDLCKIPRFNGEKFVKYKANVMGTHQEWLNAIRKCVHRQTKELNRAVLVICSSIDEVEIIKNELKKDCPFLLSFERSHQAFEESTFISNEKKKAMNSGDVVVATNLAGRGTDIETTKLLEDRGGLHVILSFLPDNIRIEEQGFGRTGRSGHEGSGEFIIMDPKRRSITELCRERDWLEQQRLEAVAKKELKKIEFEHELLRGFKHRGKRGETIVVVGFQMILETIQTSLAGEDPCYREAQLSSLKNRWAFWIDHMSEKINLVDIIGKEGVIASFEEFHEGVKADFKAGGFRLVKEPIELIKLGGEFRRAENWSRAAECYAKAAEDPHYAYALYYKAACELVQSPANDNEARHRFIREAQIASLAIKPEIIHLQSAVQSITPLVEQRQKLMGDPDFGNPFKARSEEMIQIWSIFQSAIDAAIGGSLTKEAFKSTSYIDEKGARRLLKKLKGVNRYQDSQLVDSIQNGGNELSCEGKSIKIPEMFKAALASWEGRNINRKILTNRCEQHLVTHKSIKGELERLGCKSHPIYQLSRIPLSFDWEPHGHYSEHEKFILWNIILECESLNFKLKEEISEELTAKIKANDALDKVNVASFCKMVQDNFIITDQEFDLEGVLIKPIPLEFESAKDLKERYSEGCTESFNGLTQNLKEVIIKASAYKKMTEGAEEEFQSSWSLRTSIRLSNLSIPKDGADAAEIIWATLEDQDLIEASKVKLHFGDVKGQLDTIKNTVQDFFKGTPQAEEAVDAIFNIIDSSVGMIYRLDDKKTTAKFADIIRKYYHDHSKNAPEGLGFFIELGLEVIADLIEKKDPPAWFEVLAVTVMGVIQMVAGAIIKAYLPVVGELIGNALISSGMDDVMFAITSAVNGEFSWSDYASAKVESLKRSIISSAISCGVSFGVNSVQHGVDKAWDIQKLSGLEKAALAGNSGINVGSFVLNEMKQTFISTGISQVASRGLDGMTKVIASSYENKIEEGIHNAVNAHWHVVQAQAQALYQNIRGGKSASDILKECMKTSLQKVQASGFFDASIRASKQVLPQASSLVGSGWGTFISHVPDLAQLGVSIPKLINLVEDNLHQFAREIRSAKERLLAQGGDAAPSGQSGAQTAFDRELESRKEEYVRTLKDSFTGILNGAVYAPLVSMGTQKLLEMGKDLLCPLSEAEKKGQSAEYLLKAMAAANDPNQLTLDGPARWWAGANEEVKELSEKQLKEIPENAEASIETLQNQYGSLLKVYKDKDGHLYVQRPSRDEYVQAIRKGEIDGNSGLALIAKITGMDLSITTPEGKIKTFSPTGETSLSDSISLELDTSESKTVHIKPRQAKRHASSSTQSASSSETQQNTENQFSFHSLVAGRSEQDVPLEQLMGEFANKLETDPDCIRFYHDWSVNNGQDLFLMPPDIPTAIKQLNEFIDDNPFTNQAREFIHTTLPEAVDEFMQTPFGIAAGMVIPPIIKGLEARSNWLMLGEAAEVFIASGVIAGGTITAGGVIAAGGAVAAGLYSLDNLQAQVRSSVSGKEVDTFLVQFMKEKLHRTEFEAGLMDSLVGSALSRGLNYLRSTPFKLSIVDPKKAGEIKATYVASDTGIAIPTSRAKLESILQKANVPANPILRESHIPGVPPVRKGTMYQMPNGNTVRVMEAYEHRGVRASFENANGGYINPFTNKPAQPPKGLPKKERVEYVRKHTHIDLDP